MIEYKYNQQLRLPVKLISSTGDPVVNVAYSQVTVTVEKADGTLVDFFPDNTQWLQISQGAFSAQGVYNLLLPASYNDQAGPLIYCVSVSSAKAYIGYVKLIANEESETKVELDALRTDYTTARAAKIDTINTNTAAVSSQLTDITDYHLGKWEIKVSGPDANKLILYRADGVTVLKKFALANSNGDPTFINPFSRTPL